MVLHWGIASAGKISNDFVNALKTLSTDDHQVVAVAARGADSATEFAKNHGIPRAYEGYSKLAEDADVDIVYVGSLNPQHFEISKMMLEAGKHVLCEKPLTLNEKQTTELVALAKRKNKFLKEAIWSRSFPAYHKLRSLLDSKVIGDIVQVNVSFGFNLEHVDRLKKKQLGGGSILDLGVYVLQFQQFVFKGETPNKILAMGGLNEEGTDDYACSIWGYSNDRVACLTTSVKAIYPNEAVIIGTRGTIKVPEFWCPIKIITPDKTYEFSLPESNAEYNFHHSVGLRYQVENIKQCIDNGEIESPNITHAESIQLAHHMDILRKEIGVNFPEDYN